MKKTFFLLVVVFLGFGNTDAQTEAEKLDEIDAMITSFMAKHKITGLSVGLLYKGKNELITHGREGLTINDSTTFEIGSVTKTFTTYLLAKAIETKKLNLNTTVGELLPTIKNKAVSTITLEELARHTSGLKTNPTTLKRRKKTLDPSELFTEKEFFASLEKEKVSKKKKGTESYSNTGIMLLGLCLEKGLGDSYTSLVEELFTTFKMPYANLSHFDKDNKLTQGHFKNGKEAPLWSFNAFMPAGGIHASIIDMVAYTNYQMSHYNDELGQILFDLDIENDVCLGWFNRSLSNDANLYWHNGGTSGFSSYLGMIPQMKIGVIVLSNTSSPHIDDFAIRLINKVIQL